MENRCGQERIRAQGSGLALTMPQCATAVGDLECAEITERQSQVVPLDPHIFDGDFVGAGCEGGR